MKAVIYGSTTGNTEAAAEKIAAALGGADVLSVSDTASADLDKYDVLIFGTSTWGIGDLQDDWEGNLDILEKIDYKGKKVGVFGLGDQEGYPDSFVDGMASLKAKISGVGGVLSGNWPVEGYNFDRSAAVEDGHFIGLALDEDNQPDQSDERIRTWVSQL
jgi:flavodoxin I